MMNLNRRDLTWIVLAFVLSGAASANLVTAVAEPAHRSILDLDWPAILGCAGAAMFGGVIGTLFTLHSAGENGKSINVPLQIGLDLGRAVILALVVYGVFAVYKWGPESLPGVLAIAGVFGERILAVVGKIVVKGIATIGEGISGKARP